MVLLVAAAMGLVGVFVFARTARRPPTPLADAGVRSIVVLPLQNLSGDPAQEYIVDGITEELIGALAQFRSLRVILRTSAMHYKGTRATVAEIARELGMDAIGEGSAERAIAVDPSSARPSSIRRRPMHTSGTRYSSRRWARGSR